MTFIFLLLSLFGTHEPQQTGTTIDLGVVGSYEPVKPRKRYQPENGGTFQPIKRYR